MTGKQLIVSDGVQFTLCEIDVPVVKRLLFPLESLYIAVVVTVTANVYVLPPPVNRRGPSPLWLVEMFGLWAYVTLQVYGTSSIFVPSLKVSVSLSLYVLPVSHSVLTAMFAT